MPVPVPLYSKQPAHPVLKISQSARPDYQPSVFQHLTHSLPLPPRGPPPSFATREEWISSLPSWRRNKPRHIWEEGSSHYQHLSHQGFEEGLAVADNAAVIKGTPAQACIPPISTLVASAGYTSPSRLTDMYATHKADTDDGMSTYSARENRWQCDDRSQYSDVSPLTNAEYEQMDTDRIPDAIMGSEGYHTDTPGSYVTSGHSYSTGTYERGAFTPVFEDMSPEPNIHEPGSSPMGPATPFAEFVDRAVAADQFALFDLPRPVEFTQDMRYAYPDEGCGAYCHQCHAFGKVEEPMPLPVPEPVVTPTATTTYKKLAEPLSEWIASYVWKVCTTGMSLPSAYAQPRAFVKHYPSSPPSHLASSTHSMLLSTLLQPSAIFLALWYIVRLPVFFGPVNLDRDQHIKEIRFRAELLGEAHLSLDRDTIESYAPFRLILLGCMLANKWLDDHTFSNKTWHTISNIPVQSLNKLESLALDIFRYDLSVTTLEWADWLSHLLAYHSSLNSPSVPQPISRPSTSPHTIVRKAIDRLYQVRVVESCRCHDDDVDPARPPEPLFIGIEDGKKDMQQTDPSYEDSVDVLEIDLDEDGPLREEYLPRRRVSGASSSRRSQVHDRLVTSERELPPPAKWSPAADEPIIRESVRVSRQYVAPQPIAHLSLPPPPPPPPLPFHQVLDPHSATWSYSAYMPKQEHVLFAEQAAPVFYHARPSYVAYEYAYPIAQSHVRSQSLSYNQAVAGQTHGRHRSYSQTGFDQGYSDVSYHENQIVPPPPVMSRWAPTDVAHYPPLYDRPFEYYQRPLKV